MTKLKLTFVIPVELNIESLDGVTVEDLERHLNLRLTKSLAPIDTFDVETLMHGAARLLKSATKSAIEEIHKNRYPREYVDHKTDGRVTGCTAKWILTSRKILNNIQLALSNFTGKVERA